MRTRRAAAAIWGVVGVAAVVALWELYKFLGPAEGVVIGGVTVLPRTTDIAMPHIWDMVARAFEPTTRAAQTVPLWLTTAQAAAVTLGITAVGWLVGVFFGLAIATLMQRFRTAESAILPWVVLSQTVPLIALAPVVRNWGTQLEFGGFRWENWMSVAVISSYLAFFPVAVGALRGLSSPDAAHLDLMRAYGLGWWRTYVRLRLPASVSYLLPALRLAAANAVVGTVVAEVSIGMRGGIGRAIVEFAATASSDPPKQWSPILGAVLVGLVAAGFVALIGLALRRYRRSEVNG
ncbi:ABC transporter permease [Microbacterium sp. RG1]|uniref:ABC transporter permease n=1 Tax=Microbacterium sp. RG1 TaxID=2489212 RepID=UPI0010CA3A2C|nr:ABC transporter permease subunit [Microbacterium sp. RG1]QCQ17080.1 ABC transporter permease subunit [Microbacterium sp. RG1]